MHRSETGMSAKAEFDRVIPDKERFDDDDEDDGTSVVVDDLS